MKKLIIIVSLLAMVAFVAFSGISTWNSLVSLDESVNNRWAYVNSQYQRRADLIPNIVSVVKGYAAHERKAFEDVVAARAKATQVTINADKLTPENIQAFSAAQQQLSSSLGRLLLVVERYPDLKASTHFSELNAQLEGTENRIAVERQRYNEAVKALNTTIRQFPTMIIASLLGFHTKPYFQAEEGASIAPRVSFESNNQ